jgi:pimeloyl-ACP methyl ester carboxylesterase
MLLRRTFSIAPEAAFLVLSYLTHPTGMGRSYRNPAVLREMINPRTAASLYELAFSLDVEADARAIRLPALVLHRTQSSAVPIALGRAVAMAINGASFVELPGSGHNPWDHDVEDYVELLQNFVKHSVKPSNRD